MGLINIREVLQLPAGDNATDTLINGIHFNKTALEYYNYTLYSNNTISNGSKCYLIFDDFKPIMWSNGSWVSETKCIVPYNDIATRGSMSVSFAASFAITLFLALMNLRRQGKRYLSEDKRFRIVGRRWQWYWMIFVSACGMISCITGVDVDRNYIQHLPIILQSFFFCLMLPGALAMVWEAIRHWGSWQERQIVDRDPYLLNQDDRRAKTELCLPLLFYLFTWMNFFMVIPRSWTAITYQNSPEQMDLVARPSATDARWKAAGFFAVAGLAVIVYSLHHSIKHYKKRSSTRLGNVKAFLRYTPLKFYIYLVLLSTRVAYAIASAWVWEISALKYDVDNTWLFAWGYGSVLALLVATGVFGHIEPNEDRVLIERRAEQGREQDEVLGVIKKPGWWRRMHHELRLTPEERIRALEVENDPQESLTSVLELQPMHGEIRSRSRSRPRDQVSVDSSAINSVARHEQTEVDADSVRTGFTGQTLTGESYAGPQRIRSMLDV